MPHQSLDPAITALVSSFTHRLIAAVESATAQRIQAALVGALGAPVKRGPGRPPKAALVLAPGASQAALPKPAAKVSPKTALARRLQGQYLGALNGLTAADKAKVKKLAAEKGKAAAVELAQAMKRKK